MSVMSATLSTSDTNKTLANFLKPLPSYFSFSALCVIISIIYQAFSHGIHSDFMDCAFLIPLLGGVLFAAISALRNSRRGNDIYNCGLTTLVAGAFGQGIVDIAGTDSPWIGWFFIVGATMSVIGMVVLLISPIRVNN